MPNPFVHVELSTQDVAASKDFYSHLFDWQMSEMQFDGETYTSLATGGTGGGIMKHPMPGAPTFWLAYISVDDI